MKFKRLICWILIVIMLGGTVAAALVGCAPNSTTEQPASTENQSLTAENQVKEPTKPKDVIVADINGLLQEDEPTIQKYFGISDIYTPEEIKDRISIAKVTFVSGELEDKTITTTENEATENESTKNESTKNEATENEATESKTTEYKDLDTMPGVVDGTAKVDVHICTMDYIKTKEAIDGLYERLSKENPTLRKTEMDDKVTKEIAVRAQNGEFDVHITIPVTVEYKDSEATLQLTEAFKVALTGGWYNPTGADLVSGECPLQKAAQLEADKAKEEQTKAE